MTAAAVSPLAPEQLSRAAADRRRAPSPPMRAGIRYAGRDDLMVARLAPGSTVAGVFTRSPMPGQPVDLVPRMPAARQGAGDRRQFRQCQRLHRPRRAGRSSRAPRDRGAALRLRPARGLHRLDRRHRRAAAGRPDQRGAAAAVAAARRRGLGAGGARDHDHRHLPQGRDRDRRRSTARRCRSTASPRARA